MNSKDMIVDLYQEIIKKPEFKYEIKRVLSPNSDLVLDFIGLTFQKDGCQRRNLLSINQTHLALSR